MKNNQLINSIEKTLNSIMNIINSDINEFNIDLWKKEKSKQSSSVLSRKLGLNDSLYNEFETALYQFEQYKDDPKKSKIACFRISLWLETVCKKLNLPFSIDESISNEQLAIKQVRALELLIRDVVNENLGGSQNVLLKLQELFKQDIVDKWIKSADETGVLSGTTFSELSNIFLDKDIFKTIEELVENSNLKLSKNNRDSLRYILEDIRLIRNSIAHNKKISNVQIDALNAYYLEIANLITESKSNTINPEAYLDLDMANLEEFLSSLKQDNRTIGTNIEEIKTDLKEVKSNTSAIHRKTYFIIGGIISIIFIAGIILYFVSKQSGSTDKLSHDIQDVKSIVSGDNELKNMTSTDDLSATKELNNRTKDVNAKRLAIIYFDNSGGEPSMDKLKKGLADMLITDLSNIHMLDIVERDKLESILKEQKLSNSKDFDPSAAAKVGKLLGAQIILTGGYFDMMGSLRIDARFIDVETGKILKSDGVDGATSSFFKIQKQLTWKIIRNMDTKISENEKKQLELTEKSKAISIDDLNEYSKALDLSDKGNRNEAKKIAQKIVTKYPDFMPVKNLLNKLK
jgi:TolB-like protein